MPSTNPALTAKLFLEKHLNPEKPVLLGLSGGPDSLMLFHLLLELRVSYGIAHVDHGWREESHEEAKQLELLAAKNNIPFHLNVLNPKDAIGNLEAFCRLERHKFFKRINEEYGYQAVLLGHHADDQAETVLKRVFEGANLAALSGLAPTTCINGLIIWRPLLALRKETILGWLEQKKLTAFEDKTNIDPKFLRARMRTSLIPGLSKEFGKEIAAPLAKMAKESLELKEFLIISLKPYLQNIYKDIAGSHLDLSKHFPSTIFEMKHLVRIFCQLENVILSHQQLELATDFIFSNSLNKKLLKDGKEILFHQRRLSIKMA